VTTSPLLMGFLGAGQMATALARAWRNAGLISDRSIASDPYPAAREHFTKTTELTTTTNNAEIVETCDVLVLAVKPQVMPQLLNEIRPMVTPQDLIISIAAGITLKQLADGLGESRRIVRVMPNTPCLVAACAAGISIGPHATSDDAMCVEKLFKAVGVAYSLPEHLLDAVTGLSGSGPAFVYLMIEALSDGGVRMGLPRETATMLAAQTLLGAAKMVIETRQHPGQLKDAVTSPGGTTIAGIHELERGGLRAALMNAVEAATKRATEMGGHGNK